MILHETDPLGGPSSEPDLYEIVDGKIQEKIVGVQQATFATDLLGFLWMYLRTNPIGQVVCENLFILRPNGPQRRPDLAYIAAQRWPLDRRIPAETAWAVVPNVMVEVISPSNRFVEVTGKIEEYFDAGVDQVWLVDLETFQMMIYSSMTQVTILRRNDVLQNNPLFPGFSVRMGDLFSRCLP
jgi:Uma2 family endonuclease